MKQMGNVLRMGAILLSLAGLARAEAPATQPARLIWGVDLAGQVHRFEGREVALVVLGTECPIARKAIPKLNALSAEFSKQGIEVVGLLSDPTVTRTAAKAFADEYKASFPILFDASGEIAQILKPRRTPEAFVIDAGGTVRYRGRIDDEYVSLGKPRDTITSHDLRDAALALQKDPRMPPVGTVAVGCVFEAWNTATPTGPVTYHRDIAPIMAANCVSCHRAGQVAPFTLASYQDVSKRAELITQVTKDRYMPPWKPVPQEHRFADELRLTDQELALIQRWAASGAPEGDKADALPPLPESTSPWQLGEPDLVVEMDKPFEVPASGRDQYRAFVVPVPISEDKYVTAVEFKPGDPSVVHHAILYLDSTGTGREKAAASTDGKPGYVSFGGPGFLPTGGLGGWAPGAMPAFLPEGVGKPLAKGADIVMQVHYHPDGKVHQDKSKVALYFAKKPIDKVAVNIPLNNRDINIAPGEKNYIREMSLTLPRPVELIGLTPHMHLIGQSMKVTATLPTGKEIQLIDIPQWDFRWQGQYRYETPMTLPAGTVVHASAVYDNSTDNVANPSNPPQRIRRGEQTTDEMCLVFFQIVVDKNLYQLSRARVGAGGGAGGTGAAGGALRRFFQGGE